ncbi:unnamed protein product [Didymodactylos carnosus]|uniref:SAGA-associated factor 11 n=1 Tax=Didymodactylos carnosus TaxID=1234261 RepID=A0A813YIT3_9BILA|nr:unnamed protein product [Didymodactylos carnosus]CAF3670256.1 unnamed protein product [Didymodactylos carnosus]
MKRSKMDSDSNSNDGHMHMRHHYIDDGGSDDDEQQGHHSQRLDGSGLRESINDGSYVEQRYTGPLREQDRFLPIANVAKIMKKGVPDKGKIAKDAKETIQECVSEFISFITSEASDRCLQEKRKTINGEDILLAMLTLGFDQYVEPLRLFLTKLRDASKYDRTITMGGDLSDDLRQQIAASSSSTTRTGAANNGLEPYGSSQSPSVNQLNTNDFGDKSPSYPLLHQNVLEFEINSNSVNDQQTHLSLLDSIIDDLIFDFVVELHTSDQTTLVNATTDTLQKPENGSARKRQKSFIRISSAQQPSASTINIAKFTAICPHCGQNNIVAIRFAYHLAKCLGVGRSSARTAKNRLIEYGMLDNKDEDEYAYNNEHLPTNNGILEEQYDASSCTDSTSSSVTLIPANNTLLEPKVNGIRHRPSEDEYKQDFEDEEEDDDWHPRKKRKRQTTTKQQKLRRTKKKQQEQQQQQQQLPSITHDEKKFELECIIPLEKVNPITKEAIIPIIQLTNTTIAHTTAITHKTPEKVPQKNVFFTTKKSPVYTKVPCDQSKLSYRLQPFFNISSQTSLSTSSAILPTSLPTSTTTTTTTLYPSTSFNHQFILSSTLDNSAK